VSTALPIDTVPRLPLEALPPADPPDAGCDPPDPEPHAASTRTATAHASAAGTRRNTRIFLLARGAWAASLRHPALDVVSSISRLSFPEDLRRSIGFSDGNRAAR
jgi:hypothetical protein